MHQLLKPVKLEYAMKVVEKVIEESIRKTVELARLK